MHKYKVGDKVKIVADFGEGDSDNVLFADKDLVIGNKYIISVVNYHYFLPIGLDTGASTWWVRPDMIELVSSEDDQVETAISSPSASQFLKDAEALQKQRGEDYDQEDGERSAGKVAIAFNAITGHSLTESEIWLIQQLLKDARQWSKQEYHEDSAKDGVSYSALKAESLARGFKSIGHKKC